MSDTAQTKLFRAFGAILSALLVGMLGALIWGHIGGASKGLSLSRSYITEYGFAAPHWPWIIIATFGLASALFLLSVAYLLLVERRLCVTAGCGLIAASSMALFFVSYAPIRRVEQSSTATHAWGPRWWFESRMSLTDYEDGMSDAYSDVHYHAIRLFVVNGLLGQALMAIGLYRERAWRRFAAFTMASVSCMAVLFVLCDQTKEWHGLWQRLGFAFMYGWLWSARLQLTNGTPFQIQQNRIGNAQVTRSGKRMPGTNLPA